MKCGGCSNYRDKQIDAHMMGGHTIIMSMQLLLWQILAYDSKHAHVYVYVFRLYRCKVLSYIVTTIAID
jgi:hypothetical protein